MVIIYTITSILSAFLVFLIQPVVAKIALPTLGGTPAVWSGCMLFFQAVLLCGYVYAHLLTGKVKRKYQPFVHIALLAVAVATFPLAFGGLAGVDSVEHPLAWLLAMLLVSVGLPYFVISATSPLLQRWFSQTNHKNAANPYFLYAASNIGSMGALFVYPFAIEPFATLAAQVRIWEYGISALLVLFIGVGLTLYKHANTADAVTTHEAATGLDTSKPKWKTRLHWIALAFVPSSLLYGVTSFITTDIASIPLLWIIPLTLYLLTFIFVFATKPIGIQFARRVHVLAVAVVFLFMFLGSENLLISLAVNILGIFIVSLSLHGRLSTEKPSPAYLTEFFLWMSLGGVLGGVFNTLIAPFIFNDVIEYPLVLLLSILLLKSKKQNPKINMQQLNLKRNALLLAGLVLPMLFINVFGNSETAQKVQELHKERSIFGVSKVLFNKVENVHQIKHGTTNHGVQSLNPEMHLNPVTYYSGLEKLFDAAQGRPLAVIGLGAGTLACYAEESQEMDFYEIDPVVLKIASNPEYFTYLRDCPPETRIILGDGRQQIAKQPEGKYGVMVIDAFSSDSIPTHLITKEAVELYLSKLAPDGVLAFHITNRHINMQPVLSAIANNLGIASIFHRNPDKDEKKLLYTSSWVFLAKDQKALDALIDEKGIWKPLPTSDEKKYLWTDDFSNVLFTLISLNKSIHPGFEEVAH